jgi:serine/threonine protein kinase
VNQETIVTPKICPKCHRVYAGELKNCPDDGTAYLDLEGYPPIGATFAERYEIQSLLGFGGMSIVYKARHMHMERTVAIKVLHPDLINDPIALERFQQESKAASSLTHPNIVTVYDFGMSAEGQAFFVMDCLEGPTLEDLLEKDGTVPLDRAVPIFRQICDGLETAHQKGIIHRDLKPPNIALIPQEDGTDLVKILDFGVAKFMPKADQKALRLTQTGEIFGSPLYMSPEQCLGKEIDGRSDIYALGCLMYEVLTGSPAVMADSFLEALNKHVGEEPKPFKEVAPSLDIPEEVEEIVFNCLVKDPEKRFQKIGEVKEALSGPACPQGNTIDGLTKNLTKPPVARRPRPITISFRVDSKALTWFSVLTGGFLISFIAFMAFWPGPSDDKGTLLAKTSWQVAMSLAETCYGTKSYTAANQCAEFAKSVAESLGDNNARLMGTLTMQAKILRDSGQYTEVKKVDDAISRVKAKTIEQEYAKTLAYLDSLNGKHDSLQKGLAAVNVQASVERVFRTSDELASIDRYADEEILLRRCKQVFKNLNVRDEAINAKLNWQLADCLFQQQHTLEIRSLLTEALDYCRRDKSEAGTSGVVQGLLKLGIFDKDQSDLANAKNDLEEAVALSNKQSDKHLQASCLSAYADYFHQLHDDERAKELFAQAKQLEHPAPSAPGIVN